MRKKIKAGSVVDYTFLIFIVVATLIIMGVYIQRSIMGAWREAADTFGHGRQYSGKYVVFD